MAPLVDGWDYGSWSAVYNALSFGIAGMGSATIFFWLQVPNVTKNYRTALTITGLVTFIATYHYFHLVEDPVAVRAVLVRSAGLDDAEEGVHPGRPEWAVFLPVHGHVHGGFGVPLALLLPQDVCALVPGGARLASGPSACDPVRDSRLLCARELQP